ncbi:MAG: zinc-ribbon domain-containing protein [Nitrospirae bacterium]|nr:zinc-ribbon domain-containing protein [Nitrospirota bacterium]
MIVSCECGAKLKIDDAKISGKGVKVRCPRCGNVIPVQKPAPASSMPSRTIATPVPTAPPASASGPLVLVAHDSDVVRKMVADFLSEAGFQVDTAADGIEALRKAIENKPRGMVLDVGLPGIYGFELCERLKNNPETSSIKIILLSSVYDMRRYKRTPTNLYGADDYIEKHHIPDSLVNKLRKLIFPEQVEAELRGIKDHAHHDLPEMSRPPAREFESALLSPQHHAQTERSFPEAIPSGSAVQRTGSSDGLDGSALYPESLSLEASIFQKEECNIPRVDEADPEAVEKARRFARIIVSDIALYNQEAVIEGLKNGTFYDLLRKDVEEGRELYEGRVPSLIRIKKDYYQEAFDNFMAAAQKKNSR